MILIFYLFYFVCPSFSYLSKPTKDLLFNIIRNPQTTFQQRAKVNIILFNSYKKWAIKQAFMFKMKHKYKCRHIHISELISYSTFGLYRSILKYNGKYGFIHFSTFYVNGELYKGLTNAYSMSSISKYERMKSKQNNTHNTFMLASFDEEWKFNRKDNAYAVANLEQLNYNEKMREIWEIIQKQDAFTYRILCLKYDYEFNVIRTNKHISHLMCCSEEHVRKKINNFKTRISEVICKEM